MSNAVSAAERKLRVALVWNGAVQMETTIDKPQPIVAGRGPTAMLPLPSDLATEALTLLTPAGNGYRANLAPELGGAIWRAGSREDVAALRQGSSTLDLGPDDYGVLTIGSVAVFFQHVRAAKKPGFSLVFDGTYWASQMLSAFFAAAFGGLLFLAREEADNPDALELPTDLITRFMVTPPPEDIIEQDAGGTDTDDPGIQDREEAGGAQAPEEEGRVGHEDAEQEQTEMEGEVNGGGGASQRVAEMGLLKALHSDSPLSALADGPSVSDILGGLGSARTVWGRGSGGTGLRGTGSGGGGTGPGTLFGGGGVGTGVGVGSGSGGGRGSGGPGARGRPAREVAIRMQTETPHVSGYLSPEQIMRVVRQNQAAVRYCYEAQLQRQPSLRGRIEIAWRINREGRVTTSRVARSTMGNPSVEGCIVRQVRNWRFDQPDGGEVDVVFPFIFGSGGGD
ncbi:MAG: AgmX/PglI C-terminal domain-containing protein [Sandaracinus sp.]